MPNLTADDIEKLCDNWCAAALPAEGGLQIGVETEKFRLLPNGVVFYELNHEQLLAALVGLSKVLLNPGLNTVIHYDHFFIWSWCAEILLTPQAGIFPNEQAEIHSLYASSIHAALANCEKPPSSPEEWQQQGRIASLQPHHAQHLLRKSGLVLAYIAFPLLEAVLKRACSAYVAFDGQVVSAFSVPGRQGDPRPTLYGPAGEPGKGKCSNLRDLLFLHYTNIIKPNQKRLLGRFRDHLSTLDVGQDPFDLIYGWRNQSLHGSTNFQTIGGALLSLALVISLFEVEQDYEERRLRALYTARQYDQLPFRSPWSFYPPF
ncbi:hypothetical protein Q1J68_06565 [Pseudomonas pergaminensis]|uniref:hypothetical protein n=1 Tax=Pseudomonas pergaminensis TaxID=2853159 RepID=UPI0034D5B0F1